MRLDLARLPALMLAALLLPAALGVLVAHAQGPAPSPVPIQHPRPAPPLTASAAPAPATPDARIEHHVLQDDGVRIEEWRVRGVGQRVSVQPLPRGVPAPAAVSPAASAASDAAEPPRITLPPYEILLDPTLRSPEARGATGQRVWTLIRF